MDYWKKLKSNNQESKFGPFLVAKASTADFESFM